MVQSYFSFGLDYDPDPLQPIYTTGGGLGSPVVTEHKTGINGRAAMGALLAWRNLGLFACKRHHGLHRVGAHRAVNLRLGLMGL